MAKKRTNPNEARLDIRLDPETADALKASAKEAGVSLNMLMKSICVWTTQNLHVGTPAVDANQFVTNENTEGVLWMGNTFDSNTGDQGDIYAVFDFSTDRAIRDPNEFYTEEEQ